MRSEWSKMSNSKSKCSWQRVVRKWLNIRSGANEFNSDFDCDLQRSICNCDNRRKSCSDQDCYVFVPHHDFTVISKEVGEEEAVVPPALDDPLSLRILVGTWNVGGKTPHQGFNLSEWLLSSPADIYVLGFQEIVPLNAGNVLGAEDNGPAAKWLALIRQTLNNDDDDNSLEDDGGDQSASSSPQRNQQQYRVVASKQMVGIFLCVWVRSHLCQRITNLKVSCVARGIMGYLGNKGSVSISMTLSNTRLCFVCTHLTSGEKEGDEVRRNMDVSEILKRTRFSHSFKPSAAGQPRTILEHDKVIWLGDLNYRLADGNGVGDTHELIKKHDWKALLDKDQLRIEQRAGRVFHGWEEGNIQFAPTYKYLANSDDYYVSQNSKSRHKQRTPAWCDRILWKGEGMKQEWYSRGESNFSDHRPVSSLFQLQIIHHSSSILTTNNYNNLFLQNNKANHKSNALPLPLGVAKVQAEELLPVLITRPSNSNSNSNSSHIDCSIHD